MADSKDLGEQRKTERIPELLGQSLIAEAAVNARERFFRPAEVVLDTCTNRQLQTGSGEANQYRATPVTRMDQQSVGSAVDGGIAARQARLLLEDRVSIEVGSRHFGIDTPADGANRFRPNAGLDQVEI